MGAVIKGAPLTLIWLGGMTLWTRWLVWNQRSCVHEEIEAHDASAEVAGAFLTADSVAHNIDSREDLLGSEH